MTGPSAGPCADPQPRAATGWRWPCRSPQPPALGALQSMNEHEERAAMHQPELDTQTPRRDEAFGSEPSTREPGS